MPQNHCLYVTELVKEITECIPLLYLKAFAVVLQTITPLAVAAPVVPLALHRAGNRANLWSKRSGVPLQNRRHRRLPRFFVLNVVETVDAVAPVAELARREAVAVELEALALGAVADLFVLVRTLAGLKQLSLVDRDRLLDVVGGGGALVSFRQHDGLSLLSSDEVAHVDVSRLPVGNVGRRFRGLLRDAQRPLATPNGTRRRGVKVHRPRAREVVVAQRRVGGRGGRGRRAVA